MTPRPRCGLRATSRTARISAQVATGSSSACGLSRDVRYENGLALADGDYVVVYGRFWATVNRVRWSSRTFSGSKTGGWAERWDVIQDEATAAESKSGLPMIGDRFLILPNTSSIRLRTR